MRPHGQLATVAVGLAAAIGLLLLIADTSYLRRRPLRPLRAAGEWGDPGRVKGLNKIGAGIPTLRITQPTPHPPALA